MGTVVATKLTAAQLGALWRLADGPLRQVDGAPIGDGSPVWQASRELADAGLATVWPVRGAREAEITAAGRAAAEGAR